MFTDIIDAITAQNAGLLAGVSAVGALVIGLVALAAAWFRWGPGLVRKLFSAGK